MKHPQDTTPYPRDPRSRPIDASITDGGYVYVRDVNGEVYVVPDGPHMHPKVLGCGQPAMRGPPLAFVPKRGRAGRAMTLLEPLELPDSQVQGPRSLPVRDPPGQGRGHQPWAG